MFSDRFLANIEIRGFIKVELRVAGCELRVAGYGLQVAGYGLQVTSCGLRVAGCELRVTGCGLRVASNLTDELEPGRRAMVDKRKVRVMVAKPGLDGHDRGARIIARAYRDAGFEVVYTGLHQTPEEIVEAAIQEDVDMIGLSSLAGAHKYLFPRVLELLREKGAEDIVVCGGGIFPDEDIEMLKKAGIKELFTPGSSLEEIVRWVDKNVKPR